MSHALPPQPSLAGSHRRRVQRNTYRRSEHNEHSVPFRAARQLALLQGPANSPHTPHPETLDRARALNLTCMPAAGSTGGEGVPLGGGLKNWTTNATWFAGETVPRSLHAL